MTLGVHDHNELHANGTRPVTRRKTFRNSVHCSIEKARSGLDIRPLIRASVMQHTPPLSPRLTP